jgi:hypothetical protein
VATRPFERPVGVATTGAALGAGKRTVRLFVSYARKDTAEARSLVECLKTHLASSKEFIIELWRDSDILLGEDWHGRIQKALAGCDFGLVLVSPALLASSYVQDHELVHFTSGCGNPDAKPVLPVLLKRVDFERHDLRGLERQQIFCWRNVSGKAYAYVERRRKSDKERFALDLFGEIARRLKEYFAASAPPPPLHDQPRMIAATEFEQEEPDELGICERAACCVPRPEATKHWQKPRGLFFTLRDLVALETASLRDLEGLDSASLRTADRKQGRDALAELETWATDSDAHPFFALLGEYGIGKTTTLKELTRQLLERRAQSPDDPTIPLPIYVDLRDYPGDPPVPTVHGST